MSIISSDTTTTTSTEHHCQKPPLNVFRELREYLLSDDTRLPLHASLTNTAAHPEDYTSYSGEDVWNGPHVATTQWSHDGSSTAKHSSSAPQRHETGSTGDDDGKSSVAHPPPPPSGPAVNFLLLWIRSALVALAGRDSGVVLCGKYQCASDVAWTTSSRETVLLNVRDVLVAMRMSSVFLNDLERQADECYRRCEACAGATTAYSSGGQAMTSDALDEGDVITFSLESAVTVSASTSFRLFFYASSSSVGDGEAVACLGSQRATDVLLPALARLTHEEEHSALEAMRSRIFPSPSSSSHTESTLIQQSVGLDLLKQFLGAAELARERRAQEDPPTTILAVDVVYESPTLPIYLLSAAVWRQQIPADEEEMAESCPNGSEGCEFFCLFRDYNAFCAVVMNTDGVKPPKPTRSLFIAHDADELRPVATDSGYQREDVDALLREISSHSAAGGFGAAGPTTPAMPAFVREMLQGTQNNA